MRHFNSLMAYQEEFSRLTARAVSIFRFLESLGEPRTDRQIKDSLFGEHADMNTVRPRITEMVKAGWMDEVGRTKDHVTGKPVRLVKANSMGEMLTPAKKKTDQESFMEALFD